MPGVPIEIAFGRGAIHLDLPAGAEPTIIRRTVLPKLADGRAAIRAAFAHPIGPLNLVDGVLQAVIWMPGEATASLLQITQ